MFKWKYRGNLFFFDKPSKKNFFFVQCQALTKEFVLLLELYLTNYVKKRMSLNCETIKVILRVSLI